MRLGVALIRFMPRGLGWCGSRGLGSFLRMRKLAWIAIGLALAGSVWADVRATRHNLIRASDKSVSEREVCVFCHTPVVDIGELPDGGTPLHHPLWQPSLPADHMFVIYDDIGRLGLGKPSVGSQSIACLSCHDSNQAFETGKADQDHPFGIPYRGATKNIAVVTPVRSRGGSAAPFREARHLVALEDFRDASHGIVDGRNVWWVSKDGITPRRTRTDLPLYGRSYSDSDNTGAGAEENQGALVPFIECSSCHDPHSQTPLFLRVSNESSRLCLTCHDK